MIETNKVYKMDAFELLKQLPDKSVDLVLIDPPYYNIKTNDWDNQWKKFDDYLNWIKDISIECKRVLKDSGSFYIFADDHRVAYIQVKLDKIFNFLNHIVWYKTNNFPIKYAHNHRKFCPMTERILFYSKLAEDFDKRLFINAVQEIQSYVKDLIYKYGGNVTSANEFYCKYSGKTGNYRGLFFGKSQPILYTKQQYEGLKQYIKNLGCQEDLLSYEQICEKCDREKYESLRRTFNPNKHYDVIIEPIISEKENTQHPTTKPLRVINKLIEASSNKGDVVLDCFVGSGTTAVACKQLGRNFICCDNNADYVAIANKRLSQKNLHHFYDTQNSNLRDA